MNRLTKGGKNEDYDKGWGMEEHRGRDLEGGGDEIWEEPVGSNLVPARS